MDLGDSLTVKTSALYSLVILIGIIAGIAAASIYYRRKKADKEEFQLNLSDLDKSINPTAVVSTEGKIIYANKAFLTLWEYDFLSEITDKNFSHLWKDRYQAEEIIKIASKNGAWTGQATGEKRNGTYVEILLSIYQLNETVSKHNLLMCILIDITEQNRVKNILAKEHNMLQKLVDTLPDPVYVKDINSKFVFVNQPAAKHFGFESIYELVGKTDFDILPEHIAKQYRQEEEKIIETGEPVINREGTDMFGENRSFIVTKVPWKEKNNNIIGIIGINHDITERKRVEKALQKAHDELESRVIERTSQLAKANEELTNEITERKKIEQQLTSYQEMLRTLASELSITEENLRRKIATDIHDGIGQNLAISKIKIESIKQMIDNPQAVGTIKEISNIISQTIDITRTLTFEISPPVLYELGFGAALDWLVSNIRQRHKIDAEYIDDGLHKPLDNKISILLFGAVRELLLNVVKHAKANHVQVSSKKINGQISIKVIDDGLGFDPAIINSQQPRGFGLFSIKERLGSIGGIVKIESAPKQGTQVTLTAPIDKNSSENKENHND